MTTDGFPHPLTSPPTRIRREIFQISVLIIVALAAFVGTRALAAHSRQTSGADAAEWYARGQRELADGHTAAAVEALRRATAKNRNERSYTLALARALELGGDGAAAERALLGLRESAPEDSEINLQLARLAASRSDVPGALRYYRNALYAPAAAADAGTRRAVRLELIRLLLAHDEKSRALAELIAAAADSPNDIASAVVLGRLLMEAGDDRRAADQFARALRLDARNPDALVGAGTAAFHLGRYADARRHLKAAGAETGEPRSLLALADLIAAHDPLAPRLGSAERQRRLAAALRTVTARLEACASPDVRAVAQEVKTFTTGLRPRDGGDSDVLDAGLDLIGRAEQAASPCGEPPPLDRALALIARLHGTAG